MSAKVIKAGHAYMVTHNRKETVVLAENGAHAIEIYLGNMEVEK